MVTSRMWRSIENADLLELTLEGDHLAHEVLDVVLLLEHHLGLGTQLVLEVRHLAVGVGQVTHTVVCQQLLLLLQRHCVTLQLSPLVTQTSRVRTV